MFDSDKECPLYQEKCKKHQCQWFIQLQGTHPNNGQPIDEWGCAVAWMPTLLIENAKEVRQGAAAIESFRNEMVKPNPALLAIAQEFRTTRAQAKSGFFNRLVNGLSKKESSAVVIHQK